MRAFCPNCERITEQVFIECDDYLLFDDQTVPVHLKYYVCFECDDYILVDDQFIPIHLKYYVCLECGEDYEMPSAGYDPLGELYEKLGLKTREDRKAFFDIHRIAFNISQMRQCENGKSPSTA